MEPVDFRRLMGFWATGVSVITAQGDEGPAGATANALSSLSLEPPLALVCFDLSSRTLAAVRESERFCINMLSAGQEDVYGCSRRRRARRRSSPRSTTTSSRACR